MPGPGGVCLVPGGCAWSRGVPGPGGVPGPRGECLVLRGVPGEVEGYLVQAHIPLHDSYCCGRYSSYWNAFLFGENLRDLVRMQMCKRGRAPVREYS